MIKQEQYTEEKDSKDKLEKAKHINVFHILAITIFITLGLLFLSGCEQNGNQIANQGVNETQNLEQKDFQNSAAQTTLEESTNNLQNVQEQEENIVSINQNETSQEIQPVQEIEVGSFSTPLKSKGENRLTNIRLSCEKLNGTIVKNGDRFSFNGTVGKATAEEGYKEADIIVNKKKEKGIGGGKCQVSTTLYNAADMIENVTITERHEHGKDVTYVEDGRDAAVSYGGYDLEFENHTGKDLKIYASTDDVTVLIKIVQL